MLTFVPALAIASLLAVADSDWTVLEPERLAATHGVTLRHAANGVIVAEGKNPDRTTYELDFRTELTDITAFRLEVFTDPAMTDGGPGRADRGNFVLSEFKVEASRGLLGSRASPVEFRAAGADYYQKGDSGDYPPQAAIDGEEGGKNGWAVAGHMLHEARTAVFATAKPAGFRGATLFTVRLLFESDFARHSIGKFRISASTVPNSNQVMPFQRAPDEAAIDRATQRGIAWLLDNQQADGSWAGPDMKQYHGMTALGVYTLVQCGLPKDHPAIRAAVSYTMSRPVIRTYDAGCVLMAYKVLGEPRPAGLIANVTAFLLDSMGNGNKGQSGQWGYPFGHPIGSTERHLDLSNTQYALLGLRAAAGCGERIPTSIWERCAQEVLEIQEDYGGFRYKGDHSPSASMTVAGIACLRICAEQLPSSKRGIQNKIDAAVLRAEQWLGGNWSVDTNLILGKPDDAGSKRWYYYYMYGLERVGSLSNQRLVGGHDWYAEGARALLSRQNDDGSWSTAYGEKDSNTCFALMFLIRGSRTTGRTERPKADIDDDLADAFEIASNGDNPLAAWVGELGSAVKERISDGQTVSEVAWLINGAEVAVIPQTAETVLLDRFPLHHALDFNGDHELLAEMRFSDAAGAPAGVERSVAQRVRVDSVEEATDREAVRDNTADLIEAASVECTASSNWDGHEAGLAVDGRFGTSWLAAAGDTRPMLSIKLRRPARASVLKLTSAMPYLGGEAEWARPREIEVQINGGDAFRCVLLDDPRHKQYIPFKRSGVSRVRVRILSTYPGTASPPPVGFREVELFDYDDGGDLGAMPAHQDSRDLIAPGRESGGTWRYTTTEPDEGWSHQVFEDSAWQAGEAAFGSLGIDKGCRTTWTGEQLWLRRTIELGRPPLGRLVLRVNADDQADVYLNGILAAKIDRYTQQNYRVFPLSPDLQARLSGPLITIAVRVKNTGGAAYIDVALSDVY